MPTAVPLELNLYRLIESGEVDLIEAEEPEPDLDGTLEPIFGCQPWIPAREGAKRVLVGINPQGQEIKVRVCDVCGDGLKQDGRQRLIPGQFCAACQRSLRDQDIRWLLRPE